jgi:hypothetical protein
MATTPTDITTTPPSTPVIHGPLNIDYLNESWCELQYKSGCSSTGSISHLNHSVNPEVLEKLLQEAQKESAAYAAAQASTSTSTSDPLPSTMLSPLLSSPSPKSSLIAEILSSPSSLSMSSMATVKTPMSSSSSTEITVKSGSGSRNTLSSYLPVSDSTVLISSNLTSSGGPVVSAKQAAINNIKMCADYINSDDCGGDDDDVDLEYVDEEEEEEEEEEKLKSNVEIREKLVEEQIPQCVDCVKHKKQIDSLVERQLYHEKQLIKLRKEYEEKILLSKSLVISSSSSSSSTPIYSGGESSSLMNSLCKNPNETSKYTSYSPPSLVSNVNTNSNNSNDTKTTNTNDWTNYWSSRPQAQPPK